MTEDEQLFHTCADFFATMDLTNYGKSVHALEAFAKRMQADGLREAADNLKMRLEGDGSTDDDAWNTIHWCESKAKEREG